MHQVLLYVDDVTHTSVCFISTGSTTSAEKMAKICALVMMTREFKHLLSSSKHYCYVSVLGLKN